MIIITCGKFIAITEKTYQCFRIQNEYFLAQAWNANERMKLARQKIDKMCEISFWKFYKSTKYFNIQFSLFIWKWISNLNWIIQINNGN